MMEEIAKVLEIFQKLFEFCLSLLPDSPFRPYIDALVNVPFVGYLNFFIPIADFVMLLTTWGTAIVIFYSLSLVLRFIRAIT